MRIDKVILACNAQNLDAVFTLLLSSYLLQIQMLFTLVTNIIDTALQSHEFCNSKRIGVCYFF
jgi:hypothetical protein